MRNDFLALILAKASFALTFGAAGEDLVLKDKMLFNTELSSPAWAFFNAFLLLTHLLA